MSATAASAAVRTHRPSPHERTADGRSAPAKRGHGPVPASAPEAHGGAVLFEVRFVSGMSDCDLALLARTLDISTHMYPKMSPDPNSPGVVGLDHVSGLFLKRGAAEGQWVLEARTWGDPAPESVHEWHVLAAFAARQLDPSVGVPQRLPGRSDEIPDRPVGRASNRRLSALRRHLVGL